ncbi:surfeit locus protein [Gaertneriomyces sp. JEL0708]|nr:surfeit locus protein [Gaertneriomyces sp. JEL0708]
MPATVSPGDPLEGLKGRLTEHRRTFDVLIELIPPKYYFPKEEDDQSGKFMHNKKNNAPKQVIKEATKKAKKAKLDPANAKSVLDIQQEQLLAEKEQKGDAADEPDNGDTSDGSHADDEIAFQPLPSGSITELKEKLQNRIQELRAKRKAPAEEETSAPKSRQEILEKRAKKKRERKDSIQQKKEKRRKLDDTTGMAVQGETKNSAKSQATDDVKEAVMFGNVDFGITPVAKKRKGPTDIAGQLRQAEAKKQKLEKLKQENAEKASSIEDAERWNKVLKQAEGEKVKDDVKLLKKSLKRKEQEKKKSASAWSDRQAQQKKEEDERLKKREANIKARHEGKGVKGQSKKQRPGFEGGSRKKKSK